MTRLRFITAAALSLCLCIGYAQNTTTPPDGTALPGVQIPRTPATAAQAGNITVGATPTLVDPAQAFTDGVAAYGLGQYAKARDMFAAAEANAISPALEYNFGNACYQTGDYAGAILHYLRTLALDPRDPDARKNLALARQATGMVIPEPSSLDRFADLLTLNEWTWAVVIFGWLALYLAFLPRLFRWRGALPALLCILAAILTIAGGVGLWKGTSHIHDGVVLRADTQLKFSPTSNSQPTAIVQAGEIAQTLREHNGYYEVRAADGRTGWVDQSGYAPVWR